MKLAILTGYYTGYYSNAKHPKKPQKFFDMLDKSDKVGKQRTLPVPDIDTFEAREKRFLENRNMIRRGD